MKAPIRGIPGERRPAPRARWRRIALCLCIVLLLATSVAAPRSLADPAVDWVIEVELGASGEPLSPALLGHYDLSGELFSYDQEPGLVSAMQAVGFSDWRVGVGRWEAGTWLLPTLTDATACPIVIPESAAPAGADDLALIGARDWFSDDGLPVTLADTLDDGRYELTYLRSVLDVVDGFGATPFVSLDSMPRALAVNSTPLRTECSWTFQNRVSNVRPETAAVFASAAAGLVERIVEGSGSAAARAVGYWEVWNEPELPQFWDPGFEDLGGPLDRFFEMSINTLVALDAYRSSSSHPNANDLRFGVGSFASAAVAAAALTSFDTFPLPAGFVPLDFMSFHAYSDDPLQIVDAIDTVAAAAEATSHYPGIELVLAEWGPNLSGSAGDPVYAASIQPALHIATVLALGAASGLDRAQRAIFWDFYPDSVRLGLLDHDMNPRPAYRAYELLSRMIVDGALRIAPLGIPDGRLESGNGAVLVSRGPAGTTRVLLVNRNATSRNARILFDGTPATPSRVLLYADPGAPIFETPGTGPDIIVPAESLLLVEFGPLAVPAFGTSGQLLLCAALIGARGRLLGRTGVRS